MRELYPSSRLHFISPLRPEVLDGKAEATQGISCPVKMREIYSSSRLLFISPKRPEAFVTKAEVTQRSTVPFVNEGKYP
jgi:hypothetical protein